jgi:hypothetical protein
MYRVSTLQRTNAENLKPNNPRKGIARPQSQFPHSCVCERFIYSNSNGPSAYSAAGKYVDRSWDYIIAQRLMNVGIGGRAIPRKGIHKWDFLRSACCSRRIFSKSPRVGPKCFIICDFQIFLYRVF